MGRAFFSDRPNGSTRTEILCSASPLPAMPGLYACVIGLVVFFVLRWAVRSVFASVGARALAQQPDEIHLEPRPSHAWGNPHAVETHTKALLECGFTDAGTFAIREMPPVALRLFAKPEE